MSNEMERIFEYVGIDGTRKLIGCTDLKLYDLSTTTATDITNSKTITVNKWQGVNYKNKLYLVNGADAPIETQGTSGTTLNTAWTNDPTVPSLTKANLINVSVYKERLYFVEKNTTAYWYSKASISDFGLYLEDVGQFINKGGALIYAGSWTRGTADISSDLFTIVTSQGEILVYSGLDPQAGDWQLEGHYYVGRPLGYRSVVNVGSDLLIIAEDGVFPMSALMQALGSTAYASMSDKIRNAWQAATYSYYSNENWCAVNYPRKNMLVINVPLVTDSSAEQYVLNTKTGAWCKWTGMPALCWCLYNGDIIFGAPDGSVYRADSGSVDIFEDNISAKIQTAYSAHKRPGRKLWCMAKPLFISSSEFDYLLGTSVDYVPVILQGLINAPAQSGALWDVAVWDVDYWTGGDASFAEWQALESNIGATGSVLIEGDFQGITWKLAAIDVVFQEGGIL
jgi:hypothetical protein